ncbi:cytochrome c [Rhodobacteraceae bacterium N5(2021)]|uniref:Cytochrome c n=1 Tax=Gymnodinialimonas phycosphaerae TaxID=2841589 RepID=A0A975TX44_9RHOB|nr:cytochrome c [Gymnodinialimonas phycosphaerae]MBY4892274.1 cytochrome c [Gymnodinialimonas phycosphaerae]
MDFAPTLAGAISLAALFALPVAAQQTMTAGQDQYMQACASCHGASGTGDGPLLDIIMFIDGRTGIRGHGYPMPVWGDRFSSELGESAGPYGAELAIRGRVLALAEYLESIQQ